MKYKSTTSVSETDMTEESMLILGYIESLKAETEAKISYIENTIGLIKEEINIIKEAML